MSKKPRAAAQGTWGDDDSGCAILHVDMDCFFAAVEVLDDPTLAGKPVIVGGRERGVVAAASYEARAYGVHSAMPSAVALRLCPQAIVIPGRHERYREVSHAVMAVLASITPVLEKVSIDEAFLDVTGSLRRLGSALAIGRLIRERIRDEVGVPASVGIAATKHVAKLASAHAKPDGLLLIPRAATVPFVHSLPVGALWGVGDVTRATLESKGVRTVAQLAELPPATLRRWAGSALAARLAELAAGVDERAVSPERVEKSVGTETTFARDEPERAALERVLLGQSHEVAARLRAEGLATTRIAIKVRFSDFRTLSRSHSLLGPTDIGGEIAGVARAALDQVEIPRAGVRLLGVRAEGLVAASSTGRHVTLDRSDATHAAETAMDEVRRKFAGATIAPASLLAPRRGDEEGP